MSKYLAIHQSILMEFADRERVKALGIIEQLTLLEAAVEAVPGEWVPLEHMEYFNECLGEVNIKLSEAATRLNTVICQVRECDISNHKCAKGTKLD